MKMTPKHKLMAYVLTRDPDFAYTQGKVAELFGVSQSRISESVKEIEYQRQISLLENELAQTRQELANLGYLSSAPIIPMIEG
jgi:predicted transcriptional regulator